MYADERASVHTERSTINTISSSTGDRQKKQRMGRTNIINRDIETTTTTTTTTASSTALSGCGDQPQGQCQGQWFCVQDYLLGGHRWRRYAGAPPQHFWLVQYSKVNNGILPLYNRFLGFSRNSPASDKLMCPLAAILLLHYYCPVLFHQSSTWCAIKQLAGLDSGGRNRAPAIF